MLKTYSHKMGKKQRKFQSGIATQYISRSQAIKKLQLTLRDFRRLCILKGVYPREPKNAKRANKGKTSSKTFYYTKDILFLAHEPVMKKFHDLKTHLRKVTRAKAYRDSEAVSRLQKHKPHYTLDHIVRERYPTFKDALHDVDDCLSMCFLFATFPNVSGVPSKFIQKCRRLIAEFQHYVIAAHALRKVFVSIKGIYYRADIMGEQVTWIAPHMIPFQPPNEVDFKVMLTFLEFYVSQLGFINYKLYQSLNLHYPPRLLFEDDSSKLTDRDIVEPSENMKERVYSLNHVLLTENSTAATDADADKTTVLDEFTSDEAGYSEAVQKAREEQQSLLTLQSLFAKRRIFLNREIPRETLTFIIRACGGEVSWDRALGIGATFAENDATITHQVIDRPMMNTTLTTTNNRPDRVYVQPQWIFDCVNARRLLPVDSYVPGAELPPHLSPFLDTSEPEYISHDELMRRYAEEREQLNGDAEVDESGDKAENDGVDEKAALDEENDEDEDRDADNESKVAHGKAGDGNNKTAAERKLTKNQLKRQRMKKAKAVKTAVTSGAAKARPVDAAKEAQTEAEEHRKLAAMALPKRRRHLYQQIMHSKKQGQKKINKLAEKRQNIVQEKRRAIKKQ